ncbi:carboxypeptidase regulatory-like domain-containing protein [Geomonas paludis]|uniref:Carboxypeptidase regulatory-like domain-containing protein n=1 Tax=Geomonas paludis TaxID=2740185 RepID=A0A6V8N0Z4_9BACT|nr:carboxypeptidase regulatory-like domain-containing protein [Geomonas paludis]UPU34654.1 carboxypeptidase regulatory-like domain-containing protein [Geomonas paludis]GFO65029.1 hypothetical protein GMPD_29480 [Geomonas paludis]
METSKRVALAIVSRAAGRVLLKAAAGLLNVLLLVAWASPALAASTRLGVGYAHSAAVKNDGTVWTWGYNGSGQLGVVGPDESPSPLQVPGLSGMRAVALGQEHTLALKGDGTVWAWGANSGGELGNGTNTASAVPGRVAGLTGVVAVSAGAFNGLALKSNGTVWCWGWNNSRQLGNGSDVFWSSRPVQVTGLTGVVAISMGTRHGLALKSDGTVWAWGSGILGNGSLYGSGTPVKVSGLTGVTRIAAGDDHSAAITSDGTVWTWGENGYGQIGNGTTDNSVLPVRISALGEDVAVIATGMYFTVAVKKDGTVWGWGWNELGQLGTGDTENTTTPRHVTTFTEVADVAAAERNMLVLRKDNTVWGCGMNEFGQIGNGGYNFNATPIKLSRLGTAVTALSASVLHSLALKNDGTMSAWGFNNDGRLGNGSTTSTFVPVTVSGISEVTGIAAGGIFSLGLKNDGIPYAWGYNGEGSLGNGGTTDSKVPVQVPGVFDVISLAAGPGQALVLRRDGTVWGWGTNGLGELGNETIFDQSRIPVQMTGIAGAKSICAGEYKSFVIEQDGSLWACGWHIFGMGNARSTIATKLPVAGVAAIAAGSSTHNVILKTDGTVWTWGTNEYGQLGNGTVEDNYLPIQVQGLSGVKAVQAGGWFSVALKNDGTVWTWGINGSGQLGSGNTTNSTRPVQVQGLTGVTAIASGNSYTLARKSDGTAWGWGDNFMGQLAINPGWAPIKTLITLGPQLYTLSGKVVSEGTGLPLTGVAVSIAGKSATTTTTGNFSITGIPAGTYTLTIYKSGYVTKTYTGYVMSADRTGITFHLAPASSYSISGVVRSGSSTGPVLPGATVSIAGKTSTTTSTGSFSITGIPAGTYTLTIYKFGYVTRTYTGYVVSGNRTGLLYYLVPAPTYSLSGTVRIGSSTGPALSGAALGIAGKSATTTSTGSFSITGIPGGTYTLTIYKTGYVTKTYSGYVVNGNRSGLVFYLVPAPTFSVSGMVRAGSSSGPGLAGATVAMAGKTATTTSAGTYNLSGIPAGTYTVTISKSGYTTRKVTGFAVSGNRTGVTFYLVSAALRSAIR